MIELCKELEEKLNRKLTKEEMMVLKLAFNKGREEGKKDEKEIILRCIQYNC